MQMQLIKSPEYPIQKSEILKPNDCKRSNWKKKDRGGIWHLTNEQVESMLKASRQHGRKEHRHRNYTMVLLMWQHGLRVNEMCKMTWAKIELDGLKPTIFINRLKDSSSGYHPLTGESVRALRRLKSDPTANSKYVFVSHFDRPINSRWVYTIVQRLGEAAKIPIPTSPHMLRHACGYKLINEGCNTRIIQDYLGHKQINNTEKYTALSINKFDGIWK